MTFDQWQKKIWDSKRILNEATRKEIIDGIGIIAADMMSGRGTVAHANALIAMRFALMNGAERKSDYERTETELSMMAATLGSKGGKARAGKPAAVAASRANGKLGGAPRQPRYTLATGAYTWEHLTMRDLVKIVLKKWPDHEWPEDDKEFLDELNSLDPQGVRAEEEGR